MYISVVGAAECDERVVDIAYRLGREVARRGHVLVCGGLSGVMEAACHGASDEGGTCIGVLPGADRGQANRWLTASVVTDMGHARNAIVALSGDAVIAVCGGYGTLSEIAFGLKMHKPVIGLETWELGSCRQEDDWLVPAGSPEEALDLAEQLAAAPTSHPANENLQ